MTPDATVPNYEQDEIMNDPLKQDIYSKDAVQRLLEDDELSPEEAMFMTGYSEES